MRLRAIHVLGCRKMAMHPPPPNWISEKETARLLGTSVSWLYKARKGMWKGPPSYGFNRTVKYKENEVLAFIENQRLS